MIVKRIENSKKGHAQYEFTNEAGIKIEGFQSPLGHIGPTEGNIWQFINTLTTSETASADYASKNDPELGNIKVINYRVDMKQYRMLVNFMSDLVKRMGENKIMFINPYYPAEREAQVKHKKLPEEYKAINIETTHGEILIKLEHPTRKARYFETYPEAVEAAWNDPESYRTTQIETTHGERLVKLEVPNEKARYFETHEEAVEAAYNDK